MWPESRQCSEEAPRTDSGRCKSCYKTGPASPRASRMEHAQGQPMPRQHPGEVGPYKQGHSAAANFLSLQLLLALYPASDFSMYSLTNKPFKQTIPVSTAVRFSRPALHSQRKEPRNPRRSLDSNVAQTEGWIFPGVTEKLHHLAEGKAVSDKSRAKSFDSSLPLRCTPI